MDSKLIATEHRTAQPESQPSWLQARLALGRQTLVTALEQTWTLQLLIRHPRVPWPAKAVAGCAMSYLVSPIQLIPSFIPIIGQMDDIFVLYIGMKLVRRMTPAEVLTECEARAAEAPLLKRVKRRVAGAPCEVE